MPTYTADTPKLTYVKGEPIALRYHPHFSERWVQEVIAKDPTILGLGDLELKDKERMQPKAGRLDLLLQDPDTFRRYELELQLGPTDEAHIIRTIEYWDIERRRYPQYDHCAVLVAEDITSRFLNIISLFNGSVPLIAIQMKAFAVNSHVVLTFSKVVDELTRGLVDDDENTSPADRAYWESRGSKETVAMADDILKLANSFAPDLELKYNKHYIGFALDGQAINFAVLRARKSVLNLDIKLDRSDDRQQALEDAGLDLMEYDTRYGAYRVRLHKKDLAAHSALLGSLLKAAFAERSA